MKIAQIETMEERVLFSRALGIDVSSFQGSNIDWNSVYNGGVRFAYVKATQGTGYTNPDFSSQINGATNASIIAGAYDFADYNTVSASAEANHFLSVAGSYVREGYLRPVLDMEGTTSMTKTAISNWVKSWASTVYNATGVLTVVYASQSYASSYFDSTVPAIPSQFWIANYNGQNIYTGSPGSTTPYSTWTMWQNSSTGSVPGISGDVDLNVSNGDVTTYLIPNVVSSSGAKFNKGDTIHVTASGGQKAWNTYATNDTYVTEPDGATGVVQSGTPVFIKGFERVEVKWNGSSSDTWVADNLESEGAGSAQVAVAAPAVAQAASPFSTTSIGTNDWLASN